MRLKPWRCLAHVIWALLAINYVAAQTPAPAPSPVDSSGAAEARTLNEWLLRSHEASKRLAYAGTFVMSSGGTISSAKVWHVCEGNQQMERVENLSGAPRATFRHNDQVVTFMPDQKLVRSETQESMGFFPDLLQSADHRIADFYKVRREGVDRVAGFDSDVVVLAGAELPKRPLAWPASLQAAATGLALLEPVVTLQSDQLSIQRHSQRLGQLGLCPHRARPPAAAGASA